MFPCDWPVTEVTIENCAGRLLYFDNQPLAPGAETRVPKTSILRIYTIGEALPESDAYGQPKVKPVRIILDVSMENRNHWILDRELCLRPKPSKHLPWLTSCVITVLCGSAPSS